MFIPQRFIIMILICLSTFTFFCLTISPGAMQVDLISIMNFTSGQYASLFSVSSWASLLDVVDGYLIERWWGLKLATWIFILIMTIGSAIYILSGFLQSFWLMVLGRLVYGLGCNPMFLCMNLYILHWFEGKEVNFMFSAMMSVVWLGSAFMYLITVRIMAYIRTFPWINDKMNLSITISSLSGILTIMIIVCSGTIAFLYKEQEKPLPENNQVDQQNQKLKNKKSIKHLMNFHPIFWVHASSCFLYFVVNVSFISLSQDFFRIKYNMSVTNASNLSSLFSLIAFIVSPIIGYVLDMVGRNLIFFSVGLALALIAHVLLGFTMVNPAIPTVILAVSSGISTCSWSMFQYLVKDYQYTMAYGVAQTTCNFAIALGSLGAGYIVERYGYFNLENFYVTLNAIAGGLVIIVWIMDLRMGRPLLQSTKERMERMEQKLKNVSTSDPKMSDEQSPPIRRTKKESI